MSIADKFFNWLTKSSVKNAANPKPAPHIPDSSAAQGPMRPLEYNTREEIIIGSTINISTQDVLLKGPNGELVRSHKNLSVLCGCGHLISQLQPETEKGKSPKRGLSGKCLYCEDQFQEMVLKGKMTPMEAERRALVCSECARVTLSGVLCCPKHYISVADGSGQIVYLGPEEQEQRKREEIIGKIFSPFISVLTDQDNRQLPGPEDNNE